MVARTELPSRRALKANVAAVGQMLDGNFEKATRLETGSKLDQGCPAHFQESQLGSNSRRKLRVPQKQNKETPDCGNYSHASDPRFRKGRKVVSDRLS
jgi:hypothetical protein